MSILSDTRLPGSNRSTVVPHLWETLVIAVAAGSAGYLLHHLPPLEGHLVVGIAVALVAAAAVAVGLRGSSAARSSYPLPKVLPPSPQGAETRPLVEEDLGFCAALHVEALGHGFFTRLGPSFLRTYYDSFVDSPYAVAFVAEVSGQPLGFLVGVLDNRAQTRWLIRHRGFPLAMRAGVGMALHPAAALRFLRTRVGRYLGAWRRHRGEGVQVQEPDDQQSAVLSHIAVLPGARRLGAGALLVHDFEARARVAGAAQAFLTTLEGPDGAGSFYESLGWAPSVIRPTPDGTPMREWKRDLST